MGDRTADYFRIFFEACQSLLSARSLEEILKLLVKRSVHALGVKAGSLRLVDEEGHKLELVASHLLSKKYLRKGALHLDRSIPEVLEKRPVWIRDAAEDPRVEYRDEKREEGIRGILSVPVVAKERVVGVLRLYTGQPREFDEEEIQFAASLAEVGGLAIANARIYEEQGVKLSTLLQGVGVDLPKEVRGRKRRFRSFGIKPTQAAASVREFRALHEVVRALLENLDSDRVERLMVDKVVELMGVKGGSLRIVHQTTGELQLVAARGLSEAYLSKGPVHLDRSIGEALAGTPVLIRNVAEDQRVEYPEAAAREGIASILSIPIVARERVIGVLRLYAAEPRDYSQDEVMFLAALAEIAGVAVMNAHMYERTQYDLSFWQATVSYLGGGSREGH